MKLYGIIAIMIMAALEILLMNFVVDDALESFAVCGIYLIAIGMVTVYIRYGVNHEQKG